MGDERNDPAGAHWEWALSARHAASLLAVVLVLGIGARALGWH